MVLKVEVQSDHLEALSRAAPHSALAELIWNALDADATQVSVDVERSALGGPVKIVVTDNGRGMTKKRAIEGFGQLGGSWKKEATLTEGEGRLLHGADGKGRFRAFGLGANVRWMSRAEGSSEVVVIEGTRSRLGEFEVTTQAADSQPRGTVIEVTGLVEAASRIGDSGLMEELAAQLAGYLTRYANTSVSVDGAEVVPASAIQHLAEYDLGTVPIGDGRSTTARLTVFEWSRTQPRAIYLCRASGFAVRREQPSIRAPGFNFTANLASPYFDDLSASDVDLTELDAGAQSLLERARTTLRKHFREREASEAGSVIEEWKSEEVYPYDGDPQDEIERAERQVFDIVALRVRSHLDRFDGMQPDTLRFQFRLLRQAIEENPTSVRKILEEVINLPPDQLEDLADLLDHTSLARVIKASRIVADRLAFLRGLEKLLFTADTSKATNERDHLHRMVANEPWLFGEEYAQVFKERSLTHALREHIRLTGLEVELEDEAPVKTAEGKTGRLDLMFSRRVPHHDPNKRRHLVVELKRPTQKITSEVLNQAKRYASALTRNQRFVGVDTRWVFWVVANDMDEIVRDDASQVGREFGHVVIQESYDIWVKTWSQLLDENRGRMQFVQDSLKFSDTDEAALRYLQRVHSAHLPPSGLSPAGDAQSGASSDGGAQ